MIILLAAVIGAIFGAGCILMLSRDLFRVVAGGILITNATSLLLMSAGRAPLTTLVRPLAGEVSMDPLVQALTLTAIVITFGFTALLLALSIRLFTTHGTIDLEQIAEAEEEEEERLEEEREIV